MGNLYWWGTFKSEAVIAGLHCTFFTYIVTFLVPKRTPTEYLWNDPLYLAFQTSGTASPWRFFRHSITQNKLSQGFTVKRFHFHGTFFPQLACGRFATEWFDSVLMSLVTNTTECKRVVWELFKARWERVDAVMQVLFCFGQWAGDGAVVKQGRIHGYPSRMRVGRGHNWGHQIIWAGAVRPKTTKKQKIVKCDGRTDGRMDQRTNKAGCRVA